MKTVKVVTGFAGVCLTLGGIAHGLGGDCDAAVVYPKAPNGGPQVITNDVAITLRNAPKFLGGLRIEELTVAEPCQNYYVEPTNLVSGQLLSAAKPGGWMYLLMHGTNAVGSAELTADPKTGKALDFQVLGQGNFANETLKALQMAQELPQVKKQGYELRRLDCPGVHFVAVWLHGKTDDILIPLPPTFGRWTAFHPYSEPQMIELLKAEAERRLKEAERLNAAGPKSSLRPGLRVVPSM